MEKLSQPPIGCTFTNVKNSRMEYAKDLDVDVSIKDTHEQIVLPVNGISNEGPFEFNFEPIRDTALAMDRLIMHVRAEIVDAKGSPYEAMSNITCVNFLLNTMWKSVECRVNGHPVNLSASQHSAYKSLIQTYVSVDTNSAAYLLPSLYTPESTRRSSTVLNAGLYDSTSTRRSLLNLGGGDFDMCGPIMGVDFLLSDTWLAPFNSLSLTFTRNEDEFLFNTPEVAPLTTEDFKESFRAEYQLMFNLQIKITEIQELNKARFRNKEPPVRLDELVEHKRRIKEVANQVNASIEFMASRTSYFPQLKIKDFYIVARRIELTQSALRSYFRPQALQRYVGALTEVHSHALVTGISKKTITVYSNGIVPKQIIVGMVRTSAFVGDYTLNPFDFQHFGLNKIALKVNAIRVPQEPLQPDFEKKLYKREYVHMLMNTGRWRTEVGNSISPETFEQGCTLFPWDLTPDLCCGYHTHAGKEGVVEVELAWEKPLEEQLTVLIFTCKDQIVTLDPNNAGAPSFNAF